jgi:putative N6-adenine-specific DNA methylase
MGTYHFIATAAFGLEAVVARELHQLGYTETKSHNGYVEFIGDEQAMARANLWLRTADRVHLLMGEFHADTFDALFEGTKALPWEEILPENACFPVEGRSVKSILSSVPACQSIVKKAIVEKLKQSYPRETFKETGALYRVEVAIHDDRALLTIDTSGPALHKRGYRPISAMAPIKETLAAALVLLSRWGAHRPFVDPLCGSGTIAIEAGMIALSMAPGLQRTFASEEWSLLSPRQWHDLREEAEMKIDLDIQPNIVASDVDDNVLRLAEQNIGVMGLNDIIRVVKQDVRDFRPQDAYGCIVTNPPYGERLMDTYSVESLYRTMGRSFGKADTWSSFVITSHPGFESLFGRKADKRRKLYNGRIQTNLYQYLGPLPPRHKSN